MPESLSTLESHLKALKEPVAQMQKAEEMIAKLSDVAPRRLARFMLWACRVLRCGERWRLS